MMADEFYVTEGVAAMITWIFLQHSLLNQLISATSKVPRDHREELHQALFEMALQSLCKGYRELSSLDNEILLLHQMIHYYQHYDLLESAEPCFGTC